MEHSVGVFAAKYHLAPPAYRPRNGPGNYQESEGVLQKGTGANDH